MPELRQNAATKEWVIIATERAKRPDDFKRKVDAATPALPERDASCPFCPGNEAKTPPEVFRINGGGEGWRVRVVPNRFAALNAQGEATRHQDGPHRSMNGVGIHHVLIESPLHNQTTALLPVEQISDVLTALQRQYTYATKDRRIEYVIPFKNHGETAGTSLAHPHWQMIALPLVPSQVRQRVEEAMRYFDDHGECVFCRMAADERTAKERLVVETDHFLAFCPYAAASPFHMWIVPLRHMASFVEARPRELLDLAANLRESLARIYHGLGNPDFNLVLRAAPVGHAKVEYFHWYFSIVPRLTKLAGFELGTGMFVNTALPEQSAAFLRAVELPRAAGLPPAPPSKP